jgi:hypothetical protein
MRLAHRVSSSCASSIVFDPQQECPWGVDVSGYHRQPFPSTRFSRATIGERKSYASHRHVHFWNIAQHDLWHNGELLALGRQNFPTSRIGVSGSGLEFVASHHQATISQRSIPILTSNATQISKTDRPRQTGVQAEPHQERHQDVETRLAVLLTIGFAYPATVETEL